MVAAPSTRQVVRITLTVAGVLAGLYLLFLIRSVLVLLFVALFLAVALGPAVDALVGRRVPRAGAILLTYVALLLAVAGVGLLVIPPVVDQGNQLANDLPGYVEDLRANPTLRDLDRRYGLTQRLQDQAETLPGRLGSAAGTLSSIAGSIVSTAFQLVTVLTVTFFLLLDGPRLVRLAGRGERARGLMADVYRSTSGYVVGTLTVSVVAGSVAFVALELLGVPFAVPLAVLMAFLDLIPLVGATIGGVLILLVTLTADFPTDPIVWLVVFVVYQQVENNVLQPFVYRKTVAVPALLVIVSILIGSTLLGVLGALVAIPVAAAIQLVVRDLYARRNALGSPPTPMSPGPT